VCDWNDEEVLGLNVRQILTTTLKGESILVGGFHVKDFLVNQKYLGRYILIEMTVGVFRYCVNVELE
jgi:hypothetical protein